MSGLLTVLFEEYTPTVQKLAIRFAEYLRTNGGDEGALESTTAAIATANHALAHMMEMEPNANPHATASASALLSRLNGTLTLHYLRYDPADPTTNTDDPDWAKRVQAKLDAKINRQQVKAEAMEPGSNANGNTNFLERNQQAFTKFKNGLNKLAAEAAARTNGSVHEAADALRGTATHGADLPIKSAEAASPPVEVAGNGAPLEKTYTVYELDASVANAVKEERGKHVATLEDLATKMHDIAGALPQGGKAPELVGACIDWIVGKKEQLGEA